MDEENRNSAGEDKGYNQEQAGAAFCEKLLSCCACEKIYFSRRPITLFTLSRKNFHVCSACSRTLACSVCGRPIFPQIALAVENLPSSPLGFLCTKCRDKVLIAPRTPPRNVPKRLLSAVKFALSALFGLARRIKHIEIRPRTRRR